MKFEQIYETMTRDALDGHLLYAPEQPVHVHITPEDFVCIGWQADDSLPSQRETYFDVQKIRNVLFLLHIQIAEGHRGKGLGEELYRRIEWLAADMGCDQIWQTPSGWLPSGETRESYLDRKLGYTIVKHEAYKRVVRTSA